MITTVEVERFSLISSRPFDKILAAIKAAVGHPDMVEFAKRRQPHGRFHSSKVRFGKRASNVDMIEITGSGTLTTHPSR